MELHGVGIERCSIEELGDWWALTQSLTILIFVLIVHVFDKARPCVDLRKLPSFLQSLLTFQKRSECYDRFIRYG